MLKPNIYNCPTLAADENKQAGDKFQQHASKVHSGSDFRVW